MKTTERLVYKGQCRAFGVQEESVVIRAYLAIKTSQLVWSEVRRTIPGVEFNLVYQHWDRTLG
jgi:hypothetical protein